jgi:hypothetical protein
MNEYRANLIGPDHIQSQVDLVCEHQEAAKECAKQLLDGHDAALAARKDSDVHSQRVRRPEFSASSIHVAFWRLADQV